MGFIVNAQTDSCLRRFVFCFVVTESPYVGLSLHFWPGQSFGGHIHVEREA